MRYVLFSIWFLLFSSAAFSQQLDISVPPAPGPPPILEKTAAETFTLSNGLRVVLLRNPKVPMVSYYLGLNNTNSLQGDKAGVADLTAQMMMAGTVNNTKRQILDSLKNMGSEFIITRNSLYINGLKRYSTNNLNILADLLSNPSFPHHEFSNAVSAMSGRYQSTENNPLTITDRVYGCLAFGKDFPYGETFLAKNISGLSVADCVNYYETYWRPNNAVLIVTGDFRESDMKRLITQKFAGWKKRSLPKTDFRLPTDLTDTKVDFVNSPGADAAYTIVSNLAELDYHSPDLFPVIIINYLMGNDMLEYMREQFINTDKRPRFEGFALSPDPLLGRMTMKFRSDNEKTTELLTEKISALRTLRTNKIDEQTLRSAKKEIIGRFALSTQDPVLIGSQMLAVSSGILPEEFLTSFLNKIDQVTPEDILRVSQKYIKPDQLRIVVYGDAIRIVPALELKGFDVSYYDRFGQPADKPSLAMKVPEGVTVKWLMNNYFDALGGFSRVKRINSYRQQYDIVSDGIALEAEELAKNPYCRQTLLKYNGVVYLKQTYNGNMGYIKSGKTTTPITLEEAENQRKVKAIFPLTDYQREDFHLELDSIEFVRGYPAYKLRAGFPTGDIRNYYISTDNFLVLRMEDVASPEQKSTDAQGREIYVKEKIKSWSEYGDYQMAGDVQFPHLITSGTKDKPTSRWTLKSILINPPLSTKIFR